MIKILYEDNHIIVAYKPKGILSQADGSNKEDMLTILKDYKNSLYIITLHHKLRRLLQGIGYLLVVRIVLHFDGEAWMLGAEQRAVAVTVRYP